MNKINFLVLGIAVGVILGYFATSYAVKEISPSCDAQVVPVVDRGYISVFEGETKNSKKFIYVIMFQTGYTGVLQDLVDAKKRGVDVKVIFEGGEDFLGDSFEKTCNKSRDFLKKNGVEVKFDKKNTTTHTKVIITESSVLVGSTNWSYHAIYKNNEANVLVKSTDFVYFFRKYFEDMWDKL